MESCFISKYQVSEMCEKYQEKYESFKKYSLYDLKELCRELNIKGFHKYNKHQLIVILIINTFDY